MKQQILQIDGNSIAVYESDGMGPEFLLIHGNSADGQTFKHQLSGDFGDKYRVVAIDLPGHGASSPAADPKATYCMPGYAAIVAEVVNQLQLAKPVIVGWSLGGHIALEAAGQIPNATAFAIYGTPPLGIPPAMAEAFLPNPSMAPAFIDSASEEQAKGFADACVKPGEEAHPSFLQSFLATDGRARAFLGASVGEVNYTDEIDIVADLKVPLAILHGAGEQLVNLDYMKELDIPPPERGEIQIIENAGHAPHWENPEQFNNLLAEFAADAT